MEYFENLFKQNPYLALSLVIVLVVIVIVIRRSLKIIFSLLIIIAIAAVFILYKKNYLGKDSFKKINIDKIHDKADSLRRDAREKLYKKLNDIE